MQKIEESIIQDYSTPKYINVKSNLIVAKFDLMKFTPAQAIIEEALSSGELKKQGHIIESSSGTFALALSILSSLYNINLTLVTGPVSNIVRWRLESLGAKLHIVSSSNNCKGGIQQARLNVLHSHLAEQKDAFWPQQYTNPLNSLSYEKFSNDLTNKKIDIIVGAVGSGGSLFGFSRFLRKNNASLKVVAVDHTRSVIFGAKPKKITKMCRETYEQILAMGAGIPMGNVNFEECDVVHWVPVPKMVQEVHDFHSETGILVGPSSGAALAVADWYSKYYPHKNVFALLPDHGVRYVDTIFNPEWLTQWNKDLSKNWLEPNKITSLDDVTEGWCMLDWGRKKFIDIAGVAPYLRPAGFNP